jgi:hypothetical protein
MTVGYCRTCEHWDNTKSCLLADAPGGKLEASGYESGWLYTAPDFACNQYSGPNPLTVIESNNPDASKQPVP